MVCNVLMVMTESNLSDLIERALDERGGYNLVFADNLDDALGLCMDTRFDYAFLDIELAAEDLREISSRLIATSPDVKLLIVPQEGDYGSLSLLDSKDVGNAADPNQAEDLLAEVARILLSTNSKDGVEPPRTTSSLGGLVDGNVIKHGNSEIRLIEDSSPSWLNDADRAAQKLASMSLSRSVLAAMILRDGQLWAYAGQLSQPIAQELALCVNNYWNPDVSSDLARFTDLESGRGEYMLYATGLGEGIVLTLAFETETPFSQIRTQVSGLAEELRSKSSTDSLRTNNSHEQNTGEGAGTVSVNSPVRKNPIFSLGDVPPPTPLLQNSGHGNKPSQNNLDTHRDSGDIFDESRGDLPTLDLDGWSGPNPPVLESSLAADRSASLPYERELNGETHALGDNLIHSRDFTHGTPAFYSLYYSGLLIPRLPEHQLVGDLSVRLPRYIRQIFLAFGWRLKYIDIKPQFLGWMAGLPPHIPPAKLVLRIRQHTSERIFADFPRLASENPSGDFWAPGYLLMSGQSTLPERITRYFIEQTRQQQGL